MTQKTLKELALGKGYRTATSFRDALPERLSIDSVRSHFRRENEPLEFYKRLYAEFLGVAVTEIDFSINKRP